MTERNRLPTLLVRADERGGQLFGKCERGELVGFISKRPWHVCAPRGLYFTVGGNALWGACNGQVGLKAARRNAGDPPISGAFFWTPEGGGAGESGLCRARAQSAAGPMDEPKDPKLVRAGVIEGPATRGPAMLALPA